MIAWHNPATNAPEPFADVLMAVAGEKQTAEGFCTDGGIWWYSDGHMVERPVYAWTDLPECPAKLDPTKR